MTGRNRTVTAGPSPAKTEAPKVSARKSARVHAREQQRSRDVRKRNLQMAAGVAAIVLVIAAVGSLVVIQAKSLPGRAVPNLGQQHIDKGQAHAPYNSVPPTSGPHWNIPGEAPVDWGIYDHPIPDEAQIHNLEHGGIMIQYNCTCPDLVAQLTDFYNRYTPTHKLAMFPNSTKIVIAPYPNMPSRIALTAWNRIDTFDQYDEERITKFVEAWRDKGPEISM